MTMEFTGERFIPGAGPEIAHEHYGRYLFARRFCRDKHVVDIPSGEGYGAALLAEVAQHVTGIDIDPETVAYAQTNYRRPNLSFQHGDLATFDQSLSQTTDVIVCMEGIEHIPADAQKQALRAMERSLGPDGVLIMSSPNKAIYTDHAHTHNPFHAHELYVDDLLALVKARFAHCYLFGQTMADAGIVTPLFGDSSTAADRYFMSMSSDGETISTAISDPSRFAYMIVVCSQQPIDFAAYGPDALLTVDLQRTSVHMHRTMVAHEYATRNQAEQQSLRDEIEDLSVQGAKLAQLAYELRLERDGALAQHHVASQAVASLPTVLPRLGFLEYEYQRASSRLIRLFIRILKHIPLIMPILLTLWKRLVKPVVRPFVRGVRRLGRRSKPSVVQAGSVNPALEARQKATEELFARFEATDTVSDDSLAGIEPSWCVETEPEVSIIILNWNKSDLTIRCLKEVWKHTHGHTYEIVVVDNGSDPDQYGKLMRFQGPFRLIRLSRNRYFGEGNNIGAEAAAGKYLIFLNNDAFVTPGWLNPLLATFDKYERVGAVGPMFLYPDGVVQEAGSMVKDDGAVLMRGRECFPIPDDLKVDAEVDYCSAATLAIRADVFNAINGFDLLWEPAYYEDVDLCLRVKQSGWRMFYCAGSQVVHVEHATTSDTSHRINFGDVIEINKVKFLQRWGSYLTPTGARIETGSGSISPLVAAEQVVRRPQLMAASDLFAGKNAGKPTVGLYTPYDLVPGGGERYLLTIAEHLSHDRDVTLIVDERYTHLRLGTLGHELGLDLSRLHITTYSAIHGREPFDLFIAMGNEIAPPVPSLGRHNVFICQFPFPQSDEVLIPRIANAEGYQRIVLYSNYVLRHYTRIAELYRLGVKPVTVLAPACFSLGDPHISLGEKIQLTDQQDPVQIVSIGRFFPGGHCKRHDVMIDAVREMQSLLGRTRKVELHLAGTLHTSQDCRDYYADMVTRAEGLPVYFHPNIGVGEMNQLLKRSTFYWHAAGFGADEAVYPETLEHFGISVVEAMWNGCVPLVVNQGGPAETVENGISGMHYQTVTELAFKTVDLIKHPGRLHQLQAQAYVRAEQFSEETFIEQLDALMDSLVRSPHMASVR